MLFISNALLRVDSLKDEVLAKTSHEFRTPLHGIIAISQSMIDEKEAPLTMKQMEKLTFILDIARRLSYQVNDILDFTKLKEGDLKLKAAPVDLFAVTHVVVETFSYMLDKDIEVINRIPKGRFVLGDEERVLQILTNLVENAIKYTEQGQVEIRCDEQKEYMVIEVQDSGVGIEPKNLETIFEPFKQFENSIGGTGLGLSITKELVTLQGGQITVQSVVGEGTTFSVMLPKATTPIVEKQTAEHLKGREINSTHLDIPYIKEGLKKVIIADDDHTNLKVLIDALEVEEYFIIAVDSGEAVLEQLKAHSDVDLIILDMMMPGMSGYDVCRKVRNIYQLSELPILMLTAAIRTENMEAAFQVGANDFLHKPLDSSELRTRIRNLLAMKESAETAKKMEVAFLQAQIKPHFIYNVLNSILSLSYLDLDKARSMIIDFATFLRGSFSFENTSELVPLQKELVLIESYVHLHMVRFPEQLEWEIEMEDLLDCLIPPLLLQPLVENAILHGLKTKKHGGKLKLVIKKQQDRVVFQVMDNGIGLSKEQVKDMETNQMIAGHGVALHNIYKRLHYYEEASISFHSERSKGTTVEITFPLIKNAKDEAR